MFEDAKGPIQRFEWGQYTIGGVAIPSVDVRRSIIPSLNLNPADYPESHRPLVARAIEIARDSGDEYKRHRVEVQPGNVKRLALLPHRDKRADPG